jgi:hypothetical protein
MEQRRLTKILFAVLTSAMSASPAWAQVSDVISGHVLPSIVISAPLTYGLLSLLFENWRSTKKRFIIGSLCVCPIGIYLYIEGLGYLPRHKTRFDFAATVLFYCISAAIPLLSCILLERLSLLKSLFRLLLAPLAAGAGLILMLILADVVIPYSVKAYFYNLNENCSEILFGTGAGTFPGVVFWLTRNRGLDVRTKG